MKLRWPAFWCAGLLAPLAWAQDAASPAPAQPRVVILGASVSAGFRDGPLFGGESGSDTVPLQQALGPRFEAAGAQVSSFAEMLMFNDPLGSGARQIKRALRAEPDLLVGVDFLFWYGYGPVPRTADAEPFRLGRLEQGLQLLGEFRCPILVGDLPDMTGAAPRMLAPSWIPTAEVLQRMNQRIAAWAAERDHVAVFPLSAEVRIMKEQGVLLQLGDQQIATPPGALLQGDRLHATRLGMAHLAAQLDRALRSHLADDHPLRRPDWDLPRYVEAAGAGPDLEAIRRLRSPVPAAEGTGRDH